ncbi:hypothetical protein KVT40_000694 [Elsinoe batatas]|uniref:Replication factor A protein 3 n=1 Tax=Elsinoe batatas TaxID=2601811 RepID=A0A8K0LAJ8_9PEZI|nr:hypothetical protein KVT40_000694 [Elsinoe batatas]
MQLLPTLTTPPLSPPIHFLPYSITSPQSHRRTTATSTIVITAPKMAQATPRITAPYLGQFKHQTVRVLGKVTDLRGETATIDAGGKINLLLNRDAHLQMNNAVEVIGKVDKDLSVRVLVSTDMGSGIDLSVADAVVDATHRYHEIFYDKETQ